MSHPGLESSLPGFFAAFLSAAAKADAHWYSVKLLSEGVPSLAALLGVSNNNLDMILSLSGFGRILKGGGLVFLADKFKNFLVLSDTQAYGVQGQGVLQEPTLCQGWHCEYAEYVQAWNRWTCT